MRKNRELYYFFRDKVIQYNQDANFNQIGVKFKAISNNISVEFLRKWTDLF